MLGRAMKMAFWVSFDHLGKLILLNLLSVFAFVLPFMAAYALFFAYPSRLALVPILALVFIAFCVVAPIAYAGMLLFVRQLIEKHDGEWRIFLSGASSFGPRMIALSVVYVLLFSCMTSSVFFYTIRFGASFPMLGYGLSALSLWITVFLALTLIFSAPALVYRNTGVLGALKLAAALVLDNPFFACGMLVNLLIIAVFCFFPPFLLLFSLASVTVMQCSGYEMLARKYRHLENSSTSSNRRCSSRQIDFGDEDDEYLCRGFRDFLFPWKE